MKLPTGPLPATDSSSSVNLWNATIPVAAIVVFILATVWLVTRLDSIDNRLDKIEKALPSSWTRTMMENWGLKAEKLNPSWHAPEVSRDG